MSNYIEWYLVELKLRLSGKLPEKEVETIVTEAASHLQESAHRTGLPDDSRSESEFRAIHAFGKPQEVAMAYLREADPRFMGMRPIWPVLISAFVAMACWVFHWNSLHGYFDNFGDTWKNGLALVIGLIALTFLYFACRAGYRSYRLQLLGLTVATSIGLVFLLCFWIVGSKDGHQGLNRFRLSRDVAKVERSLQKLDKVEAYLREGASLYGPTGMQLPEHFLNTTTAERRMELESGSIFPSYPAPERDRTFVIPTTYLSAYVDGRIFGFGSTTDLMEARKAWKNLGKENLLAVSRQREGLRGLLTSAQEARSGRVFFFNPKVIHDRPIWALVFLPALLFIDGLAQRAGRRRSVWPERSYA